MTTTITTGWFRFLGMNIKGTPPMKASAVRHDLLVAEARADVLVAQEFRHRWYWRTARAVLVKGKNWGTSPNSKAGIAAPVAGGQPVMWRRSLFKRKRTLTRLLHWGAAKISENRFQRAVLLAVRGYEPVRFWAYTTHNVVKGDEANDPKVRREILSGDLKRMDRFLTKLVRTGHPIAGQLDANIRKGSASYDDLMRILQRHGAVIVGEHGVEYLFFINGRDTEWEIRNHWTVPVSEVKTDHEGRGATARLVRKTAA